MMLRLFVISASRAGYVPFCVALGMLLIIAASVWAQTTRSVEGTVRDSSGAAVSGARVEVYGTEPVQTATSDAAGHYRIDGLQPGAHTLGAELAGFAPATLTIELAARSPPPISPSPP
jgi:protocatechuate 3,4-dioxygenase beta subunit